uniref:60S ribosomal protein L22-like 1 n=1 Tax=Urocitellus parryii TaxID=9999 RepID=A0A8D2KBA8_UROPR
MASSQPQKYKSPKWATWKFNLDLTCSVEDETFDSGNFKQFLQKVKVSGKTGHLRTIHLKHLKNKITVVSEKQISESYLKYITKKHLMKKNPKNLCDWLHVIIPDKTYKLSYFQISQSQD